MSARSGKNVDVQNWGVECFRYDDRGSAQRERISKMDIVGRARCLVWGPYAPLSPGRWMATAKFSMDEWACRHQFAIEFGSKLNYSRHEFRAAKPGIFEFDIEFEATDNEKVELRLIVNQSSLGGEFEFLGAKIARQSSPVSVNEIVPSA